MQLVYWFFKLKGMQTDSVLVIRRRLNMFQWTRWIHLSSAFARSWTRDKKKWGGGQFLLDDKVWENSWFWPVQNGWKPPVTCVGKGVPCGRWALLSWAPPHWSLINHVLGHIGHISTLQMLQPVSPTILHTGSWTESSHMLKSPLSNLHFQEKARRKTFYPRPSGSELEPDYNKIPQFFLETPKTKLKKDRAGEKGPHSLLQLWPSHFRIPLYEQGNWPGEVEWLIPGITPSITIGLEPEPWPPDAWAPAHSTKWRTEPLKRWCRWSFKDIILNKSLEDILQGSFYHCYWM